MSLCSPASVDVAMTHPVVDSSLFVLGPSDSFAQAKLELASNGSSRWARDDMPIVVLSLYDDAIENGNRNDNDNDNAESSDERDAMASSADHVFDDDTDDTAATEQVRSNPIAVATALQLTSMQRPWVVYTARVSRPTSVAAALNWIADHIASVAWQNRKLKL